MEQKGAARTVLLTSLLLAGLTVACFWPALRSEFINCDDQVYVTDNLIVQQGFSGEGLKWAFTTGYGANWHPLTWLSHMADVQMFGLKPWGHHAVNVLLHTASVVLLFLVLRRMTGTLGRSAIVAALFAIHPLHVESVAWVAERKDVLSTAFFMLTLWCYSHFVTGKRASLWYTLALLSFSLGLMSKPMIVTLPFVLLLLDFWPLRRLAPPHARAAKVASAHEKESAPKTNLWPLLLEKAPFFLLTIAACVVTYMVQQRGGAVMGSDQMPLEVRLLNAATAYMLYLVKTVWPVGLAPFYPYSAERAMTLGWVGLVLIALATWFAVKNWRTRPFLAVGWFWYLGTLVPVIGLVQVGLQSMADRYTYVPLVGIFIGVVWGVAELTWVRRQRPTLLAATLVCVLVLLGALTFQQVLFWQNSETLFRHTLAVTKENALAHESLGGALAKQGNLAEAMRHFEQAVRINPRYTTALNDLGLSLVTKGQVGDGIERYRQALAIDPRAPDVQYNLGRALMLQGKPEEAARSFAEAVDLKPADTEARRWLACVLSELGRVNEAESQFKELLRQNPADAAAHLYYASLLAPVGRTDDALEHFKEALRLNAHDPEVHRRYGILLARTGNTEAAAEQFEQLLRMRPDPDASYHLALTRVIQGRHAEAAVLYRQALAMNPDFVEALNDLAWILATHPDPALRDGAEAVKLATRACALTEHKKARFLGTLDAAYAESGDFENAIKTAEQVAILANESGDKPLAEMAQQRLALYRVGKPFRQEN